MGTILKSESLEPFVKDRWLRTADSSSDGIELPVWLKSWSLVPESLIELPVSFDLEASCIPEIFSSALDVEKANSKSDLNPPPDPSITPDDENQPRSSSILAPTPNVESQLLEDIINSEQS